MKNFFLAIAFVFALVLFSSPSEADAGRWFGRGGCANGSCSNANATKVDGERTAHVARPIASVVRHRAHNRQDRRRAILSRVFRGRCN